MKIPMLLSQIRPLSVLLLLAFAAPLSADIPLLRPEERQAIDAQAEAFNRAIEPALRDAAASTVRVWSGSRRLAYGTVVGEGTEVISKWSEIVGREQGLRIEAAGRALREVVIARVYPEEDLAVLAIQGEPLPAAQWSERPLELGDFLIAPQPDGRPAAFGVVSVLERNLRETDQAFLGLIGDPQFGGPGVRVADVQAGSGAAQAGLRPGDIVMKVEDREVSGIWELRNALTGRQPGDVVRLLTARDGGEQELSATLGNRDARLQQFPGARLRQMARMGGAISRVGESFGNAVQTDMRPQPNQIGGPVADLAGRLVGITLARTDRTRSFVMPAAALQRLLAGEGQEPVAVMAQMREAEQARRMAAAGMRGRGGRPAAGADPERLGRHLSDMQRLMRRMQEEFEALGVEP